MEIKEIVSYYVDVQNEILEVSFRTTEDDDEYIRQDEIDLTETKDFAYSLNVDFDDFNIIEEDDDSDNFFDTNDIEFDDEQIISFLNEYYTVHSDRLPKSEIF